MELSGKLSERVLIERQEAGRDLSGGFSGVWHTEATRWAKVEPIVRGSLSRLEADTRLTARTWRVMMRPGFAVTLDMRLRWRGRILRLLGVETDPAVPDRIIILAEELGQ